MRGSVTIKLMKHFINLKEAGVYLIRYHHMLTSKVQKVQTVNSDKLLDGDSHLQSLLGPWKPPPQYTPL